MDALKKVAALVVAVAVATTAFFYLSSGRAPDNGGAGAPSERWLAASCKLPASYVRRIEAGTFPGRSPEIHFVPHEPHRFGSFKLTTHSGPWPYLQEVPLVFYGPGYIAPLGDVTTDRRATVADLAPTFAELLGTTLPDDRPGRSLSQILLPEVARAEPPRLVLLVVWDGAGWNVLDEWPGAWPNLKRLMAEGASIQKAEVGSSPSVTPATHMTMGTGTFPNRHGIVDIPLRNGRRVVNAFPNQSPKFMNVTTLADLYDQEKNNAAKMGMMAERAWHLGMLGQGAYLDGGDKDFAVLTHGATETFTNNPNYYRLPAYLEDVGGYSTDRRNVDLSDGRGDGAWFGNPLPTDKKAGRNNPVWTRYQFRVLKELWTRAAFGRDAIPDMFFTNFKEVDLVGHVYSMNSREMRSVVKHSDDMLGKIVKHLDATVGRNRWVLAMTADHGSSPAARKVGAWPIDMDELERDIAKRYDIGVNKLFQQERPTGMWLKPDTVRDEGIAPEDIADFMIDYRLRHNLKPGRSVPRGYSDKLDDNLFAAAFPTARLDEVEGCVSP